MHPDADAPAGFRIAPVELSLPSPDSVEGALMAAGLGDRITLTRLRGAPPLARLRSQSAELSLPVPDAFDGVLSTPAVTLDDSVAL
jgi:erythromycin esterase